MFREPLAPTGQGEDFDAYLEPVRAWHDVEHAYTRYESAPARPGPELLAEVAELVARRLAAFWWLAGWRILRHVRRCPISPPHWAGRSFPM